MIPPIQFTEIGMIAPTREEVTAGLWEIMRNAFGSDLNEDARTPQGQLVTSLTAIINDRDAASIALGNNFDPRYAKDLFQDALGAIYFLTRKLETRSIAQLSFSGIQGTVIPENFLLVDDSGFEWSVIADSKIGPNGVGTADASCNTPGPIQAAPRTIRTFKQTIDGIDRVENPSAAAVGSNQESRAAFEARRYDSVAANSKNTNGAVRGAIGNLPGVIDVFVKDNFTDNTITVGSTNYSMIRNSLLVSVVGGDPQDIAKWIVIKGGTGCSFVGNTAVTWKDVDSGNVIPPEYVVNFLRPANVTTFLRLTVVDVASISYTNSEAAKASIVEQFQSGDYRARIGGLAVGANYMCALDTAAIRPVKLELSTNGTTWVPYLNFGVDQYPVTSPVNVTLVGL